MSQPGVPTVTAPSSLAWAAPPIGPGSHWWLGSDNPTNYYTTTLVPSVFELLDSQTVEDSRIYVCSGCGDWQIQIPHASLSDWLAAIPATKALIFEHRDQCPELALLVALAGCRTW